MVPPDEYEFICRRVPIVCVDLLPISPDGERVGLIRRGTYDGRTGHCLVGGAIHRRERLRDALDRHVVSSLGPTMCISDDSLSFVGVFEYFPDDRDGDLFDPRKHAVALTYTAIVEGTPEPRGEATGFAWFDRSSLPPPAAFGFGQHRVAIAALDTWSMP